MQETRRGSPDPLPERVQAALSKLLGRIAAVPSSSPCNLFQKAFCSSAESCGSLAVRHNNDSGREGKGRGGGLIGTLRAGKRGKVKE